jgi:hypothetical protein
MFRSRESVDTSVRQTEPTSKDSTKNEIRNCLVKREDRKQRTLLSHVKVSNLFALCQSDSLREGRV